MRVPTQIRPSSECSAKGTRTEVRNAVDLRDLSEYFRREHGMSRRRSEFMAREVYRDEAQAIQWLPSGWREAIYPPAVTFMRPMGALGAPFTPAQHTAWLKAGGDRAK